MTKDDIRLLFAYNAWANNRIFDALARLPEEDYRRDLKSSHGGIHGALTHIVGAEKVWFSRWTGKTEAALLKPVEVQSLQDLRAIWEKVAAGTAKYAGRLTEEMMEEDFEYTNTRGERFKHPLLHSLLHVVNHSSYHRGQITSMMRQVGTEPVNTDLIMFYRHLRPGTKPVIH